MTTAEVLRRLVRSGVDIRGIRLWSGWPNSVWVITEFYRTASRVRIKSIPRGEGGYTSSISYNLHELTGEALTLQVSRSVSEGVSILIMEK